MLSFNFLWEKSEDITFPVVFEISFIQELYPNDALGWV